jgi:uncharacterized membrane protein
MKNKEIKRFLGSESEYIKKLHQIVEESVDQEKLIINNLLNPPEEILTRGQKISDKVANFGGSWKFIITFFAVLVLWIIFNVIIISKAFDPYPFILLNLVLSCIAALQAPIIMMSQNRLEEKDRKRSENDYLINLKAEMQIRSLHQKMDLLLEDQIKTLFESQAKQLMILNKIESKLDNHLKVKS